MAFTSEVERFADVMELAQAIGLNTRQSGNAGWDAGRFVSIAQPVFFGEVDGNARERAATALEAMLSAVREHEPERVERLRNLLTRQFSGEAAQ
jgi:hypothetical protein